MSDKAIPASPDVTSAQVVSDLSSTSNMAPSKDVAVVEPETGKAALMSAAVEADSQDGTPEDGPSSPRGPVQSQNQSGGNLDVPPEYAAVCNPAAGDKTQQLLSHLTSTKKWEVTEEQLVEFKKQVAIVSKVLLNDELEKIMSAIDVAMPHLKEEDQITFWNYAFHSGTRSGRKALTENNASTTEKEKRCLAPLAIVDTYALGRMFDWAFRTGKPENLQTALAMFRGAVRYRAIAGAASYRYSWSRFHSAVKNDPWTLGKQQVPAELRFYQTFLPVLEYLEKAWLDWVYEDMKVNVTRLRLNGKDSVEATILEDYIKLIDECAASFKFEEPDRKRYRYHTAKLIPGGSWE